MENLKSAPALIIQQKKEWGEILTGFETKNRYAINSSEGAELYKAGEESHFLARVILKMMRPFVIHIVSNAGGEILRIRKPFRFYFHEVRVEDQHGGTIGRVVREFAVFKRNFNVLDAGGAEVCRISGPFWHPWTFHILSNGSSVGKISKKWSGLGKEMFTDADTFSIDFGSISEVQHRAVLVGALFLIDTLYFEAR